MTKVIFIRHGQTHSNIAGIISGRQNDPALTDEGINQAHQAGRLLKEQFGDQINSMIISSMLRTNQTAAILNQHLNIKKISHDKGLQEKDYGDWEGKLSNEYFPVLSRLADDEQIPGGESANIFKLRVINSLCPYLIEEKESLTLIVSHGHVGRIVMQEFLDNSKHFDNCEYVTIDSDEIHDLYGKCSIEQDL